MHRITEVTDEFYGSSSSKKPFNSLDQKLEFAKIPGWKQCHVLGSGYDADCKKQVNGRGEWLLARLRELVNMIAVTKRWNMMAVMERWNMMAVTKRSNMMAVTKRLNMMAVAKRSNMMAVTKRWNIGSCLALFKDLAYAIWKQQAAKI